MGHFLHTGWALDIIKYLNSHSTIIKEMLGPHFADEHPV